MDFVCWKPSLVALLVLFSVLYVFMIYTLIRSSSQISRSTACWLHTLPQPNNQHQKFNLMEETHGSEWTKENPEKFLSFADCTMEYANLHRLQQDHPCVIRLIREKYLRRPAAKSLPYQLNHSEIADPSDGQSKEILKILQNLTNGFFIECGGYDGEFLSNTLYLERSLDWTGLLVEADKKAYDQLISRNRKAYTLPTCLSTRPYPIEVFFNGTVGAYGAILDDKKGVGQPVFYAAVDFAKNRSYSDDTEHIYKIQCFPVYSILLALGRTQVDYFGLDVEGSEYKILETIPWHKINIRTITVEWNHTPQGEAGLTHLMESNKYTKTGMISNYYSREIIYVHDSFNIFREKLL